ncbi:carboxymuconolactone decarboxylase family protein [Dethiosulfatarculus sandiegensis]|uniref:Carboxymuconolactone decarboxylase-like domain-containing protein n=1 Tax=Dethiosulfatarculus sandiegensis TaxID=1429043 RepID=A0A0D2JAR2_9BACT|nr:hypothetical protein [Dethiosulfatarculus sandiegensis]KIX15224.1 hypothetical protein X474_05190 [Dethiosulfatarculus sandiegensis]
MFHLKTTPPTEATGDLAKIYAMFPKEVGVPEPFEMLSASPELIRIQAMNMGHFVHHKSLNPHVLALIRFLIATDRKLDYCINLNKGMLKRAGMTDEDFDDVLKDTARAPLEKRENQLVDFVRKTVSAPSYASDEKIQALRDQGWKDGDIFDALHHGTSMVALSILFTALRK